MTSSPSAETRARLEAVLGAAALASPGWLRFVSPGLWRWTVADTDLALKLFDGPNADERLRTEAALYRALGRAGAPTPEWVAEAAEARALARAWVPGTTLYERLLAADPPSQTESTAVRRDWLRLTSALTPWNARIAASRHEAARRKRRIELAAIAQAVTEAYPTVPAEATHALSQTVAAGELALLPLDASPSNIICDGERATFIDLELVGFDFTDWTYAKYVTAVDSDGRVRSVAPGQAAGEDFPRLDAALTLLALARAAGLWGTQRMAPEALADGLPGRSAAAQRIRAALGLESIATSDGG